MVKKKKNLRLHGHRDSGVAVDGRETREVLHHPDVISFNLGLLTPRLILQ